MHIHATQASGDKYSIGVGEKVSRELQVHMKKVVNERFCAKNAPFLQNLRAKLTKLITSVGIIEYYIFPRCEYVNIVQITNF